jgi:Asp-tRNA(Asn)/Glu-tRNA(Gln) amidotransferase A subunit family amidase
LYDPPEESALAIRKFISYGAIIIGKTKTTQFASGEGSMDWVDYQCSFNPRGDRYQDTSMSSVGSAAGLASYDWIDSSLGTDSMSFRTELPCWLTYPAFGSVLWPAAAQGIFGLRPTHSVLDNSGVPPLSEYSTPSDYSNTNNEMTDSILDILIRLDASLEVWICFSRLEMHGLMELFNTNSRSFHPTTSIETH